MARDYVYILFDCTHVYASGRSHDRYIRPYLSLHLAKRSGRTKNTTNDQPGTTSEGQGRENDHDTTRGKLFLVVRILRHPTVALASRSFNAAVSENAVRSHDVVRVYEYCIETCDLHVS